MRLYYSGEVVRYEPPKAGRQSELHQMGLEHLGGDARAADAEVLAIAAECLERLGRAGLGAGPRPRRASSTASSRAPGLDPERLEALRERVEAKDPAGVRQVLAGRRRSAARPRRRSSGSPGWPAGSRRPREAARAFAFCAAGARPRSRSCAR